MNNRLSIYIGFDGREVDAFAVTRHSIKRHLVLPVPVRGLILSDLRNCGFYDRPTSIKDGRLWDDISEAPMATEFAISRFLTPKLAGSGWALSMDCDMLIRRNLEELFDLADPKKAVMVVKHHHEPPEGTKMDNQVQTRYARKNWSSVVLWNCDHPANRKLTIDLINSVPGRDLHAFCWLDDNDIGELPPEWNYLIGHTQGVSDPAIVHFTEGLPSLPEYSGCEYADEWRNELCRWAA